MRLGYNVLLLDTDITIYEDPYRYFKQPPFNDIVVINQEEGHTAANGGVLYVQVVFQDQICLLACNMFGYGACHPCVCLRQGGSLERYLRWCLP